MPQITLTKDFMEESFMQFLGDIFKHPEILSVCVKKIVITRDTLNENGRKAFEAGFHDVYSDADIAVKVRLPKDGSVTPEEYLKRIDRFGISEDTALGWMFVPENNICRAVLKNGLRYDLEFGFVLDGDEPVDLGPYEGEDNNPDWPLENINRFWFIEIQALGKLYRRDHLISSHLANMNCNETLVMQMIMRDRKYSTNHHRYGYSEQLDYVEDLGKVPYETEDQVFNRIADHIYAAALAYDRLAKHFYPQYKDRSGDLLAIWDAYEANRVKG
jgi:hypothetical protein